MAGESATLGFLRLARAELLEEEETFGEGRPLTLTLDHVETAILWYQQTLKDREPIINECSTGKEE